MNKEHIINYIYDEMNESEKHSFKKALFENKDLRKEVNEMKVTLGLVRESSSFLPLRKEKSGNRISDFFGFRIKKRWMVAASILLLGVVGFLSGVRFHIEKNQLVIGLTSNESVEEQVQNESFISRKEFLAAVEDLKKEMVPDTFIVESEDASRMIANAVIGLDQKYQTWAEKTMVQYQDNSRKQTEEIINEFLEYYEITRTEDLYNINQGLMNLSLLVQEFNGASPAYAYQPTQK
jgi:hypothetical protein